MSRSNGEDAPAAIDALDTHRRVTARSFLASTQTDAELQGRIEEIAALAATASPWDPNAEDFELSLAILEQWSLDPAPPTKVLMAAMALAGAHHFPAPPRLANTPPWLRLYYANYIIGRPPIFLDPGESDRYTAHSTRAMAVLHQAIFEDRLPEALEIAKLVSYVDSAMIYFNEQSLKPYFRDKARIIEWLMLTQGLQPGHLFTPTRNERPRIGILHRSLAPGTETYHLLGHLVGRDRKAAHVAIYMLDGAPSSLRQAFEPWVDEFVLLPADVGGGVARMRQDDLDLCFITNNIAWGLTVETGIAAHRVARVQVVSGASPATAGFTSNDLFLTSAGNDPTPDAQDDYVEKLAFLDGAVGRFGFSHDPDPATLTVSRASFGAGDKDVIFFSAANYYKITPELITAWAEILARVPESRLVLMPFNPNWGPEYPVAMFLRRLHRLLMRQGVAPSRVRPIAKVPTRADLHAVMSLADIYLDSFPYSGACSLVDPLVVGLPIVERAGTKLRTAQGGSLLCAEGLPVSPDAQSYIERAVRLALDPAFRAEETTRVRAAAKPELACLDVPPFAKRFFAFCADAVAANAKAVEATRHATADALRKAVGDAADAAIAWNAPAFRRLHDTDVARQLLAPWLKGLARDGLAHGRVIDIGACMGEISLPFLEAGVRVDMFEPDPDCAERRPRWSGRFPAGRYIRRRLSSGGRPSA